MSSNFQKAFDMAFKNTKWDKIAMYQQLEINKTATTDFAKMCAVKAKKEIGETFQSSCIGGVFVQFSLSSDELYCTIGFCAENSVGWVE
jgi:hypothetical protein